MVMFSPPAAWKLPSAAAGGMDRCRLERAEPRLAPALAELALTLPAAARGVTGAGRGRETFLFSYAEWDGWVAKHT